MSPRDALKMAQALDLDLVKVAPQAKPDAAAASADTPEQQV